MDIKSRRSSLRKSVFSKDDENIAVGTPRQKRRISFSGRHLVREFRREEEPKTWDNSYEISDHLNVDETASKLYAAKCSVECNTNNFSVVGKENIPLTIQAALSLEPTDDNETSNMSDNVKNGSLLSNTRNLSYQNGTLCIENSVNISLFEKEKECFRNINSFSLNGTEVRALADLRYTMGEKTVEFMPDIENNDTKVATNVDESLDDVEFEYNGRREGVKVYSEKVDEVIGRDTNKAIAIRMNGYVSATHPKFPTTIRKAIQSSATLMVSPENPKDYFIKNDNMKPIDPSNANVTLNSSCIMDFTGNTKFQEKLNNISFFQHSNDEMIIEASLLAKEKETESDARVQRRQTIGFNNAIESSPVKLKESCMSSSIYLNECIKESPVKITFSKEQPNIGGIVRKSNQTPKLVVRKICTQITNKINDFENGSIQRCHEKNQEENASELITVTDAQSEPVHKNLISFSLSNIKKVSLSPDSFSQMIPTEYKTYNCKQLNDEIERGKLQLFPKTPITDRKSKKNIHFTKKISELPKERRTLFFEDDIPMSPDITSKNVSKPLDLDEYFDFNATSDELKQKKLNNANCRFSQADDLMLDNTSFLTRAKLGDETASRNSMKRDLTQINDIEFDETLKDGQIAKLEKGNNTTNCSFRSMLMDAKPVFNHGVTAINNSSMEIMECYIDKSDEEHTADSNIIRKRRQTIHMNEDIVLKNETTFQCNDKMDLGEKHISSTKLQSENILESGSGNHISRTILTDNSIDGDLKSQRKVVTYMKSTCYQNDDIYLDENVVCDDIHTDNGLAVTLKENVGSALHLRNLNIHYDEYSEEHLKERSVLNNLFKGSGVETNDTCRKTLHFDKDILVTADSIKNDIEDPSHCETLKSEHSQHTQFFEDCGNIKNIEYQKKLQCNSDRNTYRSVISQSSLRQTLGTHHLTETNPISQQQCVGMLATVADIDFDISMEENNENIHNASKKDLNEQHLTSDGAGTSAGCNLESQHTSKTILLSYDMDIDETVQILGDTLLLPNKKESSNDTPVTMNDQDFCISDIDRHSSESKSTRRTLYFNEEIAETRFCHNLQSKNNEIKKKFEILHIPRSMERTNSFKDEILKLDHDTLKEKVTFSAKNIVDMENKGTTPRKCLKNRPNFELITPRKSLDEFLAYEIGTETEGVQWGDLKENKCKSSGYNETSLKRLPVNLTPISSVHKKINTLEISKYETDKTLPSAIVEWNKSKAKCEVSGVQTAKEDMLSLATDDALLYTTPRLRISRIPLPLSSGKRTETSPFHCNIQNGNEEIEPSISDFIVENGENITESIQEVRRATTQRRRNSLLVHSEQIHSPELQRPVQRSIYEDNPITISDVSVYFHDQKKDTVNNCDMTNMAPIEKIKCKNFHKRYMNLTCDSPLEDIDQTRISLVRTLSDDDDESKVHFKEIDCHFLRYEPPETCNQIGTQAVFYNTENGNKELTSRRTAKQLENVASMCRKCKRCQDTFINESISSTTNSFLLPSLPPAPTLDMNRLRRLRTRPNISDVKVLWQCSSLNRTIINHNNISDEEAMPFGDNAHVDSPEVNNIIREYKSDIQRLMSSINIKSPFIKPSLLCHLNEILRQSNWILDSQMQYNGTLVFIHRKMLTFSLVMNYEEADALGTALQLKSVKYGISHAPQNNWEPIDFMLDFQFKLNSPYDLLILCENSTESGILRMIRKIDQICIETILMGVQLQRIVLNHGSSIIRDENRTFVRKIVRKIVSAPGKLKRVEKVEFRIEILNIKKVCFKDITMPALYSFSEGIHLLPVGLKFLNKFLQNPLDYLK